MVDSNWEPVIGLEIHAQLKTKSKLFCSDVSEFDVSDNRSISPVSYGMPGALPVLNERAVDLAILAGLAFQSTINKNSYFARKNYFYPDLPKGYQISQFDEPICIGGRIEFMSEGEKKKVSLTRAHLEEDAGKSTHMGQYSLLNFNRAGVPLLEIVSEPEIKSAKQASDYARAVRDILRYINACDGNMEEGSLRCDCNISIRKRGDSKFGKRVEIKNLNSFRFIEKALDYEIKRQISLLESQKEVEVETRLYDVAKDKTYTMRKKEDSEDYRYFPDPDLPRLQVSEEKIKESKEHIPELPLAKKERLVKDHSLSWDEVNILCEEKNMADYFEGVLAVVKDAKFTAGWITTHLFREMNDRKVGIEDVPFEKEDLGELILAIKLKKVSANMAKKILIKSWGSGEVLKKQVEAEAQSLIGNEDDLRKIIKEILQKNESQARDYNNGQKKLMSFFIGQVMKETKGKADPSVVNKILNEELEKIL